MAATITADTDAPFQLSLGEDEGLRGYPFRGFTGLNRALLNLEYRVLIPWEHRLVGIGVVPFVDAGYVWNPDDLFGCSAGIGLRIGLKKYGRTRVLRVDYAFPLVNARGKGGSLSVSTGQAFDIL
jgi:hemolysin activation/secretion protein